MDAFIRDVDYFGLRVQSGADKTCQTIDTDFLVITDIDDLPNNPIGFRDANQCLDNVEHITKASALIAISMDGDRFVQKGLAHEVWQDHAVTSSLSRPDSIEHPNDSRRNMFLAVIGKAQKLINSLRAGVTPSSFVRRAHNQIILFRKRHLGAFAIDF